MRIVFLSLFFVMSVFVVHSQNSSIGARYGFVDYASLNKVVTEAGYTAFDEDTNIQFCFGSAKRKKKTSVGFEIFFGLDNKQQNSNGNVNKLKQAGFLLDTRSALNKSKKSIVSIVFNFGFQRSNLVFYNQTKVGNLTNILSNTEVNVKSFKKNELIGQLGLGYDYISNAGFGIGLDAGYQAGYGTWKYQDLVNPDFPKEPFGHFYVGFKIYFGKGKKKSPKMKAPPSPTGPMTFAE